MQGFCDLTAHSADRGRAGSSGGTAAAQGGSIKEKAINSNRWNALTSPAAEVLAYLSEHPDAQDTLEGIVEWWLLEQKIKLMIRDVKHALANLVSRKLVVTRQGRDGRVYYRIDRRKLRPVRLLLARSPCPAGPASCAAQQP